MILQIKDVKPCPFCGSSDMLDVGWQSATTMGVECRSCLAVMERRLPGQIPSDEPDIENNSDLKTWTLNNAIRMWNKRASK